MNQKEAGTIIVTGGAGFIGSNFILDWIGATGGRVINLDKLTYAGNLRNLELVSGDRRHQFVQGDIADGELVRQLLKQHLPWAVVNFAAESHVDRSIYQPEGFVGTNVNGTFHLLQAARDHWDALTADAKKDFRFLHVSTDEVYGSLGLHDPSFTESTSYAPNSPYAASKAASDHFVRAYHHTYGLPTVIVNCSNNYGPRQFPEKLIPLMIINAVNGKPLPVYGDGQNIRDWLYVSDHCVALRAVLQAGGVGQSYNVGGNSEKTNLEIVRCICAVLDELHPDSSVMPHARLVTFVEDRPGHDRRYAIDATKIRTELGWEPAWSFEQGIRKTVRWYLDHQDWVTEAVAGEYRKWTEKHYKSREVS